MKRPSPWQICITTTDEAEDAITELLRRLGHESPSSYLDVETGRAIVSAYTATRVGAKETQTLRRGLTEIKRCGLNVGRGDISIQRVLREDWAESWKRHFRPIEIGTALLIRPGWSRQPARPGQRVVVLDPGLSFGTGQHPTTEFCLRQLAARRESGKAQSFLDIGTGSGILAIAAAKLGYAPITAFDVDAEAVRVARANARRNRVLDRIRFVQTDLARLPRTAARRHHVICANLTSDLLIGEHRRILASLRPGGTLILAGILAKEFSQVRRTYESAGLKLIASRIEKEWRSGALA
jgi:ribosomal protein L11 methyltransferase